jgi:alpha-amylase/alpha-mannosidase (GH57 family)
MAGHQRYLCIHGHFYQPPRENPWLDQIEFQASALPYHDWNQRVTRECYGPNTRARLLGEEGRIQGLLNNYAYLSFNFGPTLLTWLEKAHPWIYDQILAADRISMKARHGHGNALAQVYNHVIMPLASRRDKLTQIRWGLADFRHRFGRPAEGMWLAETAVDSESLRLMAQEGVKFTILAPDQAAMVRPIPTSRRAGPWKDVSGGRIDVTRPYRVRLDGGGQHVMTVFFYHGPISRAVAYEQLLASGEKFLTRIEEAYDGTREGPELISLATDGESYGHHFKFGDMALSWLFDHLEEGDRITLTNYGEYLERFPPRDEVKIVENSSWSCAHGVGRWCSDCGCSVGSPPGWSQAWRKPLREGMDWLAGELSRIFEERGKDLFRDPFQARDDYIAVLLRPTSQNRDRFLEHHSGRSLDGPERIEALQLLESQRMALFMFTSCGWFFDDISGLEAIQILRYAARAIDLVRSWAKKDLESRLVDLLAGARSNDPDYGDGAGVYRKKVATARIRPSLAAANYALALLGWTSVTAGRTGRAAPLEGIVIPQKEAPFRAEDAEGIVGEAIIAESGTGAKTTRVFLAYHIPDGIFGCMVGKGLGTMDLEEMTKEMAERFSGGGEAAIRAAFDRHVEDVRPYTIRDMIPDMRHALMSGMFQWLDRQIGRTIGGRRRESEAFLNLLQETGGPLPEAPNHILSILIADELRKIAEAAGKKKIIDWAWLDLLARQAALQRIKLDDRFMKQTAQSILRILMASLSSEAAVEPITGIIGFLDMCQGIGVEPDLWACQNAWYDLYRSHASPAGSDAKLSRGLRQLGERLGFTASPV